MMKIIYKKNASYYPNNMPEFLYNNHYSKTRTNHQYLFSFSVLYMLPCVPFSLKDSLIIFCDSRFYNSLEQPGLPAYWGVHSRRINLYRCISYARSMKFQQPIYCYAPRLNLSWDQQRNIFLVSWLFTRFCRR
jgi:hypothetical protein